MFAKRGSAHFAKRSYAGTKVTRPPGRDPALQARTNPITTKAQTGGAARALSPLQRLWCASLAVKLLFARNASSVQAAPDSRYRLTAPRPKRADRPSAM